MPMQEKIVWGTFIFVVLTITLGTRLVLGILSFYVAATYGNDQCMVKYAGIDLDYGQWLSICGIWEIVEVTLALVIIGMIRIGIACESEMCALIMSLILQSFLILCSLFQFAWFVVGSIVYFTEVMPHCAAASSIFQFGLAFFIVRLVLIVSSLGANRSQ